VTALKNGVDIYMRSI